jgi:protein-disulfide isomerase
MQEEYSTETTTSPSVVQQESSLMSTLGVPIAIVVGALLIGGAIIYTGTTRSGIPLQVGNGANDNEQVTADVEVAPVTDKDHILGNPNAPIMIVEYSDFDCPFCKNFHETMQKIMETYGKDGKVAWVYRHFPLEQLHPNAPKVAAASECVAALGGNDAFWKFANKLISDRGTNEPTNITKLPEYASNEAGTYNEKIQKDIEEALKTGARGTPYSVIIVGDQQAVINGAQPYTAVKAMIDNLITQMGGTAE